MPDSRYDDIIFRIISTLLCLGLFLKDQWPHKLQSFLPFYWYLTITFCLPFTGTYLFLENHASSSWMLNSTLGIFLMLFVLDWLSFTLILFCGITLGILAYTIGGKEFIIIESNFLSTIINIIWVVIVALLFSRKREILQKEKEDILTASAGAIAHEMRTPLANVLMSATALQKTAGRMEEAIGQEASKKDRVLKDESHDLNKLSDRLGRIARGSQNFINLLLTNLRQDFKQVPLAPLSIEKCLQNVMEEYAFRLHEQDKVHLNIEKDFVFQGNEELMIHVFFNLLKNSLYFIQATGKGEVFITIDSTHVYNQVIFKDTGPGIEPHRLAHLFKPFYSKRPHGTGIGLSFCKKAIESMGGRIEASSIFGQETTFTLYLPKSKEISINNDIASLT